MPVDPEITAESDDHDVTDIIIDGNMITLRSCADTLALIGDMTNSLVKGKPKDQYFIVLIILIYMILLLFQILPPACPPQMIQKIRLKTQSQWTKLRKHFCQKKLKPWCQVHKFAAHL